MEGKTKGKGAHRVPVRLAVLHPMAGDPGGPYIPKLPQI